MNSTDVHSVLTLHRFRMAELHADADRERLARTVRGRRRLWRRSST